MLKIKYLHIHFADDQRYTLPSSVLPNLPDEGKSYTKQDIEMLCKYAKKREVILIPEIEMPGHVKILNKKYPEILCQQYIKKHKLKDSKELYAEFVKRTTDYVLSRGRTPIVWEGFSDENSNMISKDVLVISWENHYQNVYDLLKNGFKVINCSWQPLYVVNGIFEHERYHFEDILDWNVYEWKHWWLESDASLNPIQIQPTEQVLGAQICAWGLTYEMEIQRIVENLAALSERSWSVKRICNKYDYQNKAYKILDKIYMLISEE